MPLSHCSECGNQIAPKTKVCPNCGTPVKNNTPWGIFAFLILVIVLLTVYAMREDEPKPKPEAISFYSPPPVQSIEESAAHPKPGEIQFEPNFNAIPPQRFTNSLPPVQSIVTQPKESPESYVPEPVNGFSSGEKVEPNRIVFITDTGGKYHRQGCQFLAQSRYHLRMLDAIRNGYGPCEVCFPNGVLPIPVTILKNGDDFERFQNETRDQWDYDQTAMRNHIDYIQETVPYEVEANQQAFRSHLDAQNRGVVNQLNTTDERLERINRKYKEEHKKKK